MKKEKKILTLHPIRVIHLSSDWIIKHPQVIFKDLAEVLMILLTIIWQYFWNLTNEVHAFCISSFPGM